MSFELGFGVSAPLFPSNSCPSWPGSVNASELLPSIGLCPSPLHAANDGKIRATAASSALRPSLPVIKGAKFCIGGSLELVHEALATTRIRAVAESFAPSCVGSAHEQHSGRDEAPLFPFAVGWTVANLRQSWRRLRPTWRVL